MIENKLFHEYVAESPNWEKEHHVYKRDDNTYKRIPLCWEENQLHHEYHSSINTKTGDIYLDCRKRKIFTKHVTLMFVRPLHTIVAKTLWHATIIGPLAIEIFKTMKHKQTGKDLLLNMGRSCADIVRTPLYGTAITITHLAGIILAAFSPNTLYKTREIAGNLERKMLRVDNIFDGGGWILSPCFSPMENISTLSDPAHFAKKQINFRKKHAALFNDCGSLFPSNKAYVSAAAPKA